MARDVGQGRGRSRDPHPRHKLFGAGRRDAISRRRLCDRRHGGEDLQPLWGACPADIQPCGGADRAAPGVQHRHLLPRHLHVRRHGRRRRRRELPSRRLCWRRSGAGRGGARRGHRRRRRCVSLRICRSPGAGRAPPPTRPVSTSLLPPLSSLPAVFPAVASVGRGHVADPQRDRTRLGDERHTARHRPSTVGLDQVGPG